MAKRKKGNSGTRTITKYVHVPAKTKHYAKKAWGSFRGEGFSDDIKMFGAVLLLRMMSSFLFGGKDKTGAPTKGLFKNVDSSDLLMKYAIMWVVSRTLLKKFAPAKYFNPIHNVITVKFADAIAGKLGESIPMIAMGGDTFSGDNFSGNFAGEGDIVEDSTTGQRFVVSRSASGQLEYAPLSGMNHAGQVEMNDDDIGGDDDTRQDSDQMEGDNFS